MKSLSTHPFFFVALLLTTPQSVLAVSYTFTSIEGPGASSTQAFGVSKKGQVVGTFHNDTGTHGFLKDGATFTIIDVPSPNQPPSPSTFAYSINSAGQIVGNFGSGDHSFLKDGSTITLFEVPGAAGDSRAFGINDAGQIVGSYGSGGRTHAFLKEGATFTTFDVPGARTLTQAFGISNAGQIVGIYDDATTGFIHGFLANVEGGDETEVGDFTTIDVPGAFSTSTLGVNRAGQVVGLYEDNIGNGVHSFLKEGSIFTTINVPFPTAQGTEVRSINDSGQIVGDWGDGRVIHGFVATPVPESSTWLLLSSGLVGLAFARRKFSA